MIRHAITIGVFLIALLSIIQTEVRAQSSAPMCFVMTLEVQARSTTDAQELRDAVMRILKTRFELFHLTPMRMAQSGSYRIVVAWSREPDLQLVSRVATQLGLLEFRRVIRESSLLEELAPEEDEEILPYAECSRDPARCIYYLVKKDPFLTSAALAKAALRHADNPNLPPYYIALTLSDEGAKQWREVILQLQPQRDRLAIVIDRVVYSAPMIARSLFEAASRADKIHQSVVTGNFTREEAQLLTNVLNSGVLPAEVKILESGFARSELCPGSTDVRFFTMVGIALFIAIVASLFLKR